MVLLLGALLLAAAVLLLAVALGGGRDARGVARSLELLQAASATPEVVAAEAGTSFGERVLDPLRGRVLGVGRRLAGREAGDRVRRRLDLAGNPAGWTVDRYLTGTVLGAIGGLGAAGVVALLLAPAVPVLVLLLLAGALLGFFAPGLYLYQLGYDRAERIRRGLPDAIDLLTISVEAGLGFDAAVQQVARNTEGPLADELARVLREMQLGLSRSAALRSLAERTSVQELRTFVGAMVQADTLGIPIGQVLRVQAREIRVKRRQRAEERAQQVPVKITIPLIFCILPCLFVVVLGPAALSIMDTF
ncbi:MAG TPA: type II secretion system F family protein [Nocardioides sp.]|nr:type II secretion system F family protein [Nocardioides sp.]